MLADPELLTQEEWIKGCETGHVDTSYIKKSLNSYDESALELACRCRDNSEEECELSALIIGDKVGDNVLNTLAALGFTRLVRIDANTDREELSSEEIIGLLLAWLRMQEPFDVIVTGIKSGDGNQGKLPIAVAEEMGMRCITHVTEFKARGDEYLEVDWDTDSSHCKANMECPLVLAVGTVASSYLRVPTLADRMKTKGKETEIINASELACQVNEVTRPRLISMTAVDETRETMAIDGDDANYAAEQIASYYGKWKEA